MKKEKKLASLKLWRSGSKVKKVLIIILGILILLVVAVCAVRFLSGDEDTWICSGGQWVKHGNPSVSMPTIECKK